MTESPPLLTLPFSLTPFYSPLFTFPSPFHSPFLYFPSSFHSPSPVHFSFSSLFLISSLSPYFPSLHNYPILCLTFFFPSPLSTLFLFPFFPFSVFPFFLERSSVSIEVGVDGSTIDNANGRTNGHRSAKGRTNTTMVFFPPTGSGYQSAAAAAKWALEVCPLSVY